MKARKDEMEETIQFNDPITSSSSTWRWKISLGILIYGMILNGNIYGFMSPALPTLSSISNLTQVEISWISSVTSLGTPIGSLSAGILIDTIGFKWTTLIFQSGTYILGHFLMTCASILDVDEENNHFIVYWSLLSGRFINGICQGFCNCVSYVYILDLCINDKIGRLCGVLMSITGFSGTMMTYLIGGFVLDDWRKLSASLTLWVLPYILGILVLVPESPQFYLKRGNKKMALKAIQQLHGPNGENQSIIHYKIAISEYEKSRETSSTSTVAVMKSEYLRPENLKIILLCLILLFFYQFSGYNITSTYALDILNSHSSVDDVTHGVAVAVAGAGLLGVIFSSYLVSKVEDSRILMTTSLIGTCVSFLILSLNETYNANHEDWSFKFFAGLGLISHILCLSSGLAALGYPTLAEIIPLNIRPVTLSFVMTFGGFFGFLNTKSYADLTIFFGNNRAFTYIFYSFVNALGAIFIYIYINPDKIKKSQENGANIKSFSVPPVIHHDTLVINTECSQKLIK